MYPKMMSGNDDTILEKFKSNSLAFAKFSPTSGTIFVLTRQTNITARQR